MGAGTPTIWTVDVEKGTLIRANFLSEIRTAIENEFKRRKGAGSIEPMSIETNYTGKLIQASPIIEIVKNINKLNSDNGDFGAAVGKIISADTITLIRQVINSLEMCSTECNTRDSGCSNLCMGMCTSCDSSCTSGCSGSCRGGCGDCTGSCSGMCGWECHMNCHSCGGSCDVDCGNACSILGKQDIYSMLKRIKKYITVTV